MRKAVKIGTMVVGAGMTVLTMTACQPAGTKAGAPAPATSTAPSTSATPSTSASSAADNGNGQGTGTGNGTGTGGTGTGGGSGQGNGGTGNGSGQNAGSAQIVYFKIIQQPRCASGTTEFETPAVPLKVSWKVTGATGIALSVDDPDLIGSYGRYGTEGALEFTFSCGGQVGSMESHVYILTTTGGTGAAKAKSLTVATKVLERGVKV